MKTKSFFFPLLKIVNTTNPPVSVYGTGTWSSLVVPDHFIKGYRPLPVDVSLVKQTFL
jgi:hypothetical protein